MPEDYTAHYLPNGIRLLFKPSEKFKTISIGLFVHQELNSDLAALSALLPSVLEQGSSRYPDYLTLQRQLENLYGAEIGTDIIKSGEKHILAFTMELAHDRFIGEGTDLLGKGMAVLGSILAEPLLEGGAFRPDYVAQEKNQLVKDIRALLNDKAAYAMERCLQLMCGEERFGVYKLGRVEDYDKISPERLYSYYSDTFASNPIDLYVIGDLDGAAVAEAAASAFNFPRSESLKVLPETEITVPVTELKRLEEEMTVNQAKLVLGYRTYTGYTDPLYCALQVYSGLLGGFPHSKLFMKVREEASLAYYIHSRLEKHKGLMFIAAGINASDRSKAEEIINEQLADTAAGRITDHELDHTKRGLINALLSRQDSPGQMISFHLDGSVGGRVYSTAELVSGIEKVTVEDIRAVAQKVKADTAYLLKPREGAK